MRLTRTSPGTTVFAGRRAIRGPHKLAVLGVLVLGVLTGCAVPPPSALSAEAARPGGALAPPDVRSLPEATTFGNIPATTPDPESRSTNGGVVLHVKQELVVHDAPGGRAVAKLPATQLGSPTWVPVVSEQDGWARVLLPSRPNHSTGWVRTGAQTELARSKYTVDVDVNARRLVVRDDRGELGSWTVGVGKAGTPTPRGRTFIMASIKETVTRFSPVILPLGAHSETLSTYGGGPGTVALHGWPDPSVFGKASSDGCIRVPADALRLLTSLPLGTLVLVR